MARLSWLHITDLHQGFSDQQWLWPTFREEFYADLRRVANKTGAWDVVLFTGDLTQSGTDAEFAAVQNTLNDLWAYFRSLGMEPRLLAVPGNHDLERPSKRDPIVKLLRSWHSDEDIRADFWRDADSPYRRAVTTAFSTFSVWWNNLDLPRLPLVPGELPGEASAVLEKDGVRFGFVGLNTAFLQLTDDDYDGRLDLTERQLHTACGGDAARWCSDNDVNFLLTHHPLEWLDMSARERFRAEIAPPGRFFAHVAGHLHEAVANSVSEGGAVGRRSWVGRSLFGFKFYGEAHRQAERSHGYTVGTLDLQGLRGVLKLWPRESRLLQAGHRKLVPDHSFDLGDDESITDEFTTSGRTSLPPNEGGGLLVNTRDPGHGVGGQAGLITLEDLVERPPTREQAQEKLRTVARWRILQAPAHLAVRTGEQERFKADIAKHRVAWLVADWGLARRAFYTRPVRPAARGLSSFESTARKFSPLSRCVKRQSGNSA